MFDYRYLIPSSTKKFPAMKNQELEERLIDFAVLIIKIASSIKKTRAGLTMEGQIVKSGTSPALNYGEVRGAESNKDFIHKLQVVLKELRETSIALKIIKRAQLSSDFKLIDLTLSENDELISIFVKSVNTSKNRVQKIAGRQSSI